MNRWWNGKLAKKVTKKLIDFAVCARKCTASRYGSTLVFAHHHTVLVVRAILLPLGKIFSWCQALRIYDYSRRML